MMSGLELLRALRADPLCQNIPIILLSAGFGEQHVREANAFIQKPFKIEVLESVITEVLKTKGNRLRVKFE
jgi:CheY-like chemotaxis protein